MSGSGTRQRSGLPSAYPLALGKPGRQAAAVTWRSFLPSARVCRVPDTRQKGPLPSVWLCRVPLLCRVYIVAECGTRQNSSLPSVRLLALGKESCTRQRPCSRGDILRSTLQVATHHRISYSYMDYMTKCWHVARSTTGICPQRLLSFFCFFLTGHQKWHSTVYFRDYVNPEVGRGTQRGKHLWSDPCCTASTRWRQFSLHWDEGPHAFLFHLVSPLCLLVLYISELNHIDQTNSYGRQQANGDHFISLFSSPLLSYTWRE